ncbi:MAG: ATP/GTP-binding protein [Corynebacterium sp.]|uniref:ATP/GTP-binding protein n=1 Tax=Corynebacterium sp. TaxID=1720 RepID=UPI0026DCF107|nr:ATP/GTP-binding protein [Corynebacterium sp.]MDO5029395.1 ATP/GTP-binding protein [Corynebacterium sp.]
MPRRNHKRRGNGQGRGGKNSRRRGGNSSLPAFGSTFQSTRTESGPAGWQDVDFSVRNISAGQSTKVYRCPGCDQEIMPGTSHIVAWPQHYGAGADDRRHWHTNCWRNRAHRTITRRWG